MVKKGAKAKRASAAAGDGASDTSSFTADRGRSRTGSDEDDVQLDPWEAAWDQIMDGNSAMRAQGITRVCNLLRSSWEPDYVSESVDRFVDVARSALTSRKSDAREQGAAAAMLALLFITLGREFEGFFGELQSTLRHACQEGKAKAAATYALAVGAFCCPGVDADDLDAVRFLAGLWLTSSGEALVAALRGWALVVTGTDVRVLSIPLIQAVLSALSNLLAGKDLAVRNAAATALGVLYQRCGLEVGGGDVDGADDVDDASESGVSGLSIDGSSCAVSSSAREVLEAGFESIVMRMSDLSRNRGDKAKLSKQDRRASKEASGRVLAAMNGEGIKTEVFKLKSGERVEFDTLEARVQRDLLREALQGGFQVHMNRNPLLQEVFGHQGADAEGGALVPPPRWHAASDRVATHRQRQSASRQQQASHMMEEEYC